MTPPPGSEPRTDAAAFDVESALDPGRFPVDEWALVESEPSTHDLGVTETLFVVANGYMGLRGNVEEGREAHTQGTFLNGFHETWPIQHAEDAFGFAKVGQTLVHVPDPKLIKLYVDDEPLLIAEADTDFYERRLDFRSGILERTVMWRTAAGLRIRVRSTRQVSFTERHLALMTFEVTMLEGTAPVTVSSQLLNRQEGHDEYHVPGAALGEGDAADPRQAHAFEHRVLLPRLSRVEGSRATLGYRCANSAMTLACATDHIVETSSDADVSTEANDDVAKTVVRTRLAAGQTLKITKYATFHSSRGVPAPELADRCARTLDRCIDRGSEALAADQRSWLDEFWDRSDVTVGTTARTQQAVRWNLFQLAQATGRVEGHGVAAKGVTGTGYGGHYFWDTEVYVMPFCTYTNPQQARNLLRFRYLMLPKARERAAELSQRGALFPWRTINGDEASAYYAAGTAQYHINADVVHALSQYIEATGDWDFLCSEGAELAIETARLYSDLGFYKPNGPSTFHIFGVTGPDEYTTVVNDNLFTNLMARFNLRRAAEAMEVIREEDPEAYQRLQRVVGLRDEEVEEWRAAEAAMFIPYDEELGVHPQDDAFLDKEVWDLPDTPAEKRPLLLHYHPLVIYRHQVLKQADVVLAMFLQGEYFTREEKRRNFEYYDPITTGDSSLSACAQAILAAEVGYGALAEEYFNRALFVDLADLQGNACDGVHVASTGGVWTTLVQGFAGMRDVWGVMAFDPRLPRGWTHLGFTLHRLGCRLRVDLEPHSITLTLAEGGPVWIGVGTRRYKVSTDAPTVVALDDQGPVIDGRPPRLADVGVVPHDAPDNDVGDLHA
ncbi:MAG: glycosyl hydrolase family 65 protein [Microthrixaceae bacterium]